MDVTALEDDGGVPDALSFGGVDGFDGAANDGDAQRGGIGSELLDRFVGLFQEVGAIEEVLRGVTEEGEFGENDDIGAGFGGTTGGAEHESCVTRKIANNRIDLAEGDAHTLFYGLSGESCSKLAGSSEKR